MSSFFDNKARAAAAASASSSSRAKSDAIVVAPRLQPWVEKYRPKNLDEVKSQDHVSSILKKMVQASNLPHLLLYGPPGTGKTSTILALCRELFPPEMFSSRVLELNASDERGITVVREKIKNFAQQAVTQAPKNSKYPCPPFKIIILDEADSLTQDSQSALRRTMEIYSKTTRICFCCNYVSRIIDPVASRCSKFRFKALDGGDAKDRVAEILSAEGVAYEDGVIEQVLKICEGDLRRALQLLQSAARLVGTVSASTTERNGKSRKSKVIADEDDDEDDDDVEMTDADTATGSASKSKKPSQSDQKKITPVIIDEIAGVVPTSTIDNLIKVMRKGRSMNFSNLHATVDDIIYDGYSATEVLSSLYTKLLFDELLESRHKAKISLILSEMDMRLNHGADESLLLNNMVMQIAEILAKG